MASRDEFSPGVVEQLAKRAAYCCSNPDCRGLTLAPSDADKSKSVYWGKAAHISAAASGGPRYDESLTETERSSPENGIFLCSTCADKVDKNQGIDYPADQLRSWKQQHDEFIKTNPKLLSLQNAVIVDGLHEAHGHGKVTGLDIQELAFLQPGTVSRASGTGEITATRIGPKKEEEE